MRHLLLATAAALTLAACAETSDTAANTDMANADSEAAMQEGPAMAMADYASGAAISDMYEIESSRLALTRASSDEVQDYAQRMITDHTRTSNQLNSFVQSNGSGMALPTQLDARHQGMIAQLRSASGTDFDRLYMTQQQTAHDEALALHRGYAEGGDNQEARTLARTTVGVIEQHHQLLRAAMPAGTAGNDTGMMRESQGGGVSGGGSGTSGMSGGTTGNTNSGARSDDMRSGQTGTPPQ